MERPILTGLVLGAGSGAVIGALATPVFNLLAGVDTGDLTNIFTCASEYIGPIGTSAVIGAIPCAAGGVVLGAIANAEAPEELQL